MTGLLLLAACGGAGETTNSAESGIAGAPENGLATGNALEAANVIEPENAADAAPADARPLVNLAPGALSLVDPNNGRARELRFGVDRTTAERAVQAALGGRAERGTSRECGEGPMDFARMPGGLLILFQDDRFVGWFLDRGDATLTTASGIGIGSTRKELTGAYDAEISESSLGEEFTAGDLSGLLSGTEPTAKVTAIWSGQVCNLR
ncbi:hypothetical protein [Sphingomonas sp.]|uniref:hypothetical protein n=1 Tax=Sphingomonas sp. TaxID=28214 RepID=UPI0031D7EC6A